MLTAHSRGTRILHCRLARQNIFLLLGDVDDQRFMGSMIEDGKNTSADQNYTIQAKNQNNHYAQNEIYTIETRSFTIADQSS